RHRGAADGGGRDHAAGPVRRPPAGRARGGGALGPPARAAAEHGPEAALPREAGGEQRDPAAELLRDAARAAAAGVRGDRLRGPAVKLLVTICYLGVALPVAAASAGVRVGVDASGYPEVQGTVVGSAPSSRPPVVREGGVPVVGLRA